jgi:nitrite reductase/ring-hydroxylating ferredoxin subunit
LLLCYLEEIPEGDARGFDPLGVGHDTVLLVRQGRRLYAWRDSCPHIDGTPMAWRKNAYLNSNRDRIVCNAHGALFDIVTGICELGPCLGQALTPLRVTLDDDDTVYLEMDGPQARRPGPAPGP